MKYLFLSKSLSFAYKKIFHEFNYRSDRFNMFFSYYVKKIPKKINNWNFILNTIYGPNFVLKYDEAKKYFLAKNVSYFINFLKILFVQKNDIFQIAILMSLIIIWNYQGFYLFNMILLIQIIMIKQFHLKK